MEDIIIWIVIVALYSAYEFLKKKSAKHDAADSRVSNKEPLAPSSRPKRPQPARIVLPSSGGCGRPAPFVMNSGGDAVATTVYSPAINEDEGQSILMRDNDEPDAEAKALSEVLSTEALESHYARWRQAIIDTQILERKF